MATHFYQMRAIAYLSPYEISYTNIVINILNMKECLNIISNLTLVFLHFYVKALSISHPCRLMWTLLYYLKAVSTNLFHHWTQYFLVYWILSVVKTVE